MPGNQSRGKEFILRAVFNKRWSEWINDYEDSRSRSLGQEKRSLGGPPLPLLGAVRPYACSPLVIDKSAPKRLLDERIQKARQANRYPENETGGELKWTAKHPSQAPANGYCRSAQVTVKSPAAEAVNAHGTELSLLFHQGGPC